MGSQHTKRTKRRSNVTSRFKGGYADGWKFKLPLAFQGALDIRRTKRAGSGKTISVPTQGRNFSFKLGDLMYTSTLSYEMLWEQALRVPQYAIQITSDDGHLTFDLFYSAKRRFSLFKSYRATQEQFVQFLRFGEMYDLDRQSVCLTDISKMLDQQGHSQFRDLVNR